MVSNKIFGTDGIRDIANSGWLRPEFLVKLGKIIGSDIINQSFKKRVIIGRDTRLSGEMIECALSAGLISSGVDIIKAGVISTPGLAYLTKCGKYSLGIMISASHNPADYNGIKLFLSNGLKITTPIEEKIEKHIFSDIGACLTGHPVRRWAVPPQCLSEVCLPPVARLALRGGRYRKKSVHKTLSAPKGSVLEISKRDLLQKYIDDTIKIVLGSKINKWASGMKIVIDSANGSLFEIAQALFKKIGATVTTIHNSADGVNINHRCGSLHPEVIRRKVLATKSHIGFSFDGDGDRVILVDEKGNIRDGDFVLYIAASYFKKHRLLEKNTIVGTIMTNSALEKLLAERDIKLIRTPVGDKYVLDQMLKNNLVLGGEPSGHIIFSDYSKNGDGLITALIMLKIIKEEQKSLFKLAEALQKYPQIIVNVPVKSKPPLEEIKPIQKKTAEINKILNNQGRLVLRYSGTESLARIMMEGKNLHQIKSLAKDLSKTIENIL
ncbi:MAG: phosphoglucosamine mutase [Planctomycetota bacterium]